MKCPICNHVMKSNECPFCGYIHDAQKMYSLYESVSKKHVNKSFTNFIVTLCFGWLGAHKFLQGKMMAGLLYLFTVGGFVFGWIYDCIIAYKNYSESKRVAETLFGQKTPENHVIQNNVSYGSAPAHADYDAMDGHTFEHYCADLLRENNFRNVEVTQASGDHGIDILADKNGITYAIQCKRYSTDIGNAAVQQALAGKGFYRKDIAAVLTNRYFTAQAQQEAEILGVKLWDRDFLNRLVDRKEV